MLSNRKYIYTFLIFQSFSQYLHAQGNNFNTIDVNEPGTSEENFSNYSDVGMNFGNENQINNSQSTNNSSTNNSNSMNANPNVVSPTNVGQGNQVPVQSGTQTPVGNSSNVDYQSQNAAANNQIQTNNVNLPQQSGALIPTNEFSGAPMIPGTLRNMADGEAPEEYITEMGDTLYDICEQLLDEGGYWPKLWALNPHIKNPHFIWPGMRLVFFAGDDSVPPFMEVASENDIVPIDKDGLQESQLLTGNVPDFTKIYDRQMTEFIDHDDATLMDQMNQIVTVSGDRFNPTERRFSIPGFIYSDQKSYKGIVVSGMDGQVIMGEASDLIMSVEEGVSIGSTFTVLRPHGSIKNPVSNEDIGYYYSAVAHVRIKEMIKGGEFAIAEITQNILGVEPNDVLVDYISTNRSISLTEVASSISSLDANIIGFNNATQTLSGEGGMVFIDKGNNGGVTKGQFFNIYSQAGRAAGGQVSEALDGYRVPVATIKIVDTTDVASVGFIIKNDKEISLGDWLNKGG